MRTPYTLAASQAQVDYRYSVPTAAFSESCAAILTYRSGTTGFFMIVAFILPGLRLAVA